MKKFHVDTHLSFLVWVTLLPLTWACSPVQRSADSGMQSSKALSMSRIVIPAAGGQTIQLPEKMMADAYGLWHPLREAELKRLGSAQPMPLSGFGTEHIAWFPPSEKDIMQKYVHRLTHQRRDLAQRVLGRADRYFPTILAAIERRGLPIELACLPMVESAFEPSAISHAGAAGLWQLMPETAKRFGLTVTDTLDERFDVQKSTEAATAYLAILYAKFGNWPLAVAAYNCGEGAMQRALVTTNTTSLSELTSACRAMGFPSSPLAEETLRFVPQFAAAVHIMSDSDTFGLTRHPFVSPAPRLRPEEAGTDSMALTGRHEPSTVPQTIPARSRRIE